VLGGLGVATVAAVVASAFAPVPYVTLSPGRARPTEPLVAVSGAQTFPSAGELLFTTVHVDGVSNRLTLLEALDGWVDDNVDVFPQDAILGQQTPEENRQRNQTLMDTSKDTAVLVALAHLGYDVAVVGTGATIVEVVADSPADGTVAVGETVTAVDGQPIALSEELATAIAAHVPGDTASLSIEGPNGGVRIAEVTLVPRQDDAAKGFLGVATQTRDLDYQLPFDVTIDSGNVGGPSAGLAFTLAVLDVLTPDELTGGAEIAVTGTIQADGTVGPVGGIAQKVAAVRRSDADVFLVPVDEYDEALEHAGDGLRIEAVGTLDDALEVLASLGGNALALPTVGQDGEGA
jgi:PDZ domain-containing protein